MPIQLESFSKAELMFVTCRVSITLQVAFHCNISDPKPNYSKYSKITPVLYTHR